jgi:hypothetical protein
MSKPARQCPSCGGFCGRGGCERENDKPAPPAALLEAAHETVHYLEGQQAHEEDDCGDPVCRDCEPRRERQRVIDALRAALGVER